MRGRRVRKDAGTRRGIAYVALLLLLTLLFTLGMVFLMQTANDGAAILARGNALQAHYLAESAANHALWLLLNEDVSGLEDDEYYMHDFAGGRYGYKIRPHTDTTFATVATVGAIGDTVVRQSYVVYVKPQIVNVLGVYVANLLDLSILIPLSVPTIVTREFNGVTWENAESSLSLSSPGRWTALAGNPVADAFISMRMTGNSIAARVRQGGNWTSNYTFSTTGDSAYQCFDAAFEGVSGQGLVVGRKGTAAVPYYATWSGSSWHASSAAGYPGGALRFVDIAPSPSSDNMLVGISSANADLSVYRWTGSALSFVAEVETSLENATLPCFTLAYEQQSGDGLIVWSEQNNASPQYRRWNGSSLGLEGSTPSFGAAPRILCSAADPESDRIVVGGVDAGNDINLALWGGTAWEGNGELTASAVRSDRQCFDLAWESEDSKIFAVWGGTDGLGRLYYFSWTYGTPLSSAVLGIGPTTGSPIALIQLETLKDDMGVAIYAGCDNGDLYSVLWDGSAFVSGSLQKLTGDLRFTTGMPFGIAEAG